MKNRKPVAGYVIALLLVGTAVSCSDDKFRTAAPITTPPADHSGNRNQVVNGVAGDTLAVVDLGEAGFVGFYEFAPGELAIRQSLIAAPNPGPKNARRAASQQISHQLDRMSEQGQSLVDIYKAIAPTQSPTTITRLASAQHRAATAKRRSPPVRRSAYPPPAPALDQATGQRARTAAWGCAPDYYNDNYGAQWFIDNYVNESRFRKSLTNQSKATWITINGSWSKIAAMAADFETGIHFSGKRWKCGFLGLGCEWQTRWSFDIGPRGVETWYIYSDLEYWSTATGYYPCQRVHLGACTNGEVYN